MASEYFKKMAEEIGVEMRMKEQVALDKHRDAGNILTCIAIGCYAKNVNVAIINIQTFSSRFTHRDIVYAVTDSMEPKQIIDESFLTRQGRLYPVEVSDDGETFTCIRVFDSMNHEERRVFSTKTGEFLGRESS